ncbi:MAG: ATP-binding protein, partial [Pseudomonadota bacterium]
QMQSRPVDLNDLIRDVVELYKNDRGLTAGDVVPLHRADDKPGKGKAPRSVATKLDLYGDLPVISADPGRLRQVLHNLLLNAREALAATPKPMIRVSTRVLAENTHRFAELKIQDNGPGFPEVQLVRLYEPYVTSKEKGTGLGLAIVKRIVEEHGGTILAENLKDGGACVIIRLPIGGAVAVPAEKSPVTKTARAEKNA